MGPQRRTSYLDAQAAAVGPPPAAAETDHGGRGPWTWRGLGLLTAVFCAALGAGSVVASWTRLSATIDEGIHVATGLEWLQHGSYTLWTENPPLARVAVALGPYLAGARLPPPEAYAPAAGDMLAAKLGSAFFYRDGAYLRNLAQARAGTLPFFLLAVLLTGLLASRAGGWLAGVIAAVAMATLPPLLGHAALATTDVAFLATFLLAVWALMLWGRTPTAPRAAFLGLAAALAVLTKFTALVFLPAVTLALIALQPKPWAIRPLAGELRRRAPGLALALAMVVLVVWAGYRFSFGDAGGPAYRTRMAWVQVLQPPAERRGIEARLTSAPLPAPSLFNGLLFLRAHNQAGHPAFLLGEQRQHGFRAFYPVALFFKAPLPFLVLVVAGVGWLVLGWRNRASRAGLALATAALALVVALVPSQVNLGVRHALPVYALIAAAAAAGLAQLISALGGRLRVAAGCAVAGLLLGQQVASAQAFPDRVAYFNALAGADPERILEGSDLDWGQGVLELASQTRARNVDRLHTALGVAATRQCEHGLPPLVALRPHTPVTGWVAISERVYNGRREDTALRDPCDPTSVWGRNTGLPPGWYRWLHAHEPVWKGSGIRLYRIDQPARGAGSR